MTGSSRWIVMLGVSLAVLIPSGGCFVAADLVSPELLSTLGYDASAFTGESGTVIVVLNNASSFEATMSVVASFDAVGTVLQDAGRQNIAAGSVWMASFDCPVFSVQPGQLVGGAISTTAVTVTNAEGTAVALTYEQAAPEAGRDFTCGDVIEIRLLQVGEGGDAEEDFLVQVLVRPGR